MNGSSPTIWLQDDRGGKEVAEALWNHRGVRNLAELPVSSTLRPEEAQGTTLGDGPGYVPQEGDRRASIQRQIKERRGAATLPRRAQASIWRLMPGDGV